MLNFRREPYDWKKKQTWTCDQLKANNWSVENVKKHVASGRELAAKPAIRSCDTS